MTKINTREAKAVTSLAQTISCGLSATCTRWSFMISALSICGVDETTGGVSGLCLLRSCLVLRVWFVLTILLIECWFILCVQYTKWTRNGEITPFCHPCAQAPFMKEAIFGANYHLDVRIVTWMRPCMDTISGLCRESNLRRPVRKPSRQSRFILTLTSLTEGWRPTENAVLIRGRDYFPRSEDGMEFLLIVRLFYGGFDALYSYFFKERITFKFTLLVGDRDWAELQSEGDNRSRTRNEESNIADRCVVWCCVTGLRNLQATIWPTYISICMSRPA